MPLRQLIETKPIRIQAATDESPTVELSGSASRAEWGDSSGMSVRIVPDGAGASVISVSAPETVGLRRLHVRWAYAFAEGARFLGDHWERGYGDLEWRGLVPERKLPWYFLSAQGEGTDGIGVRTGGDALAWWQVDGGGVSLFLEVGCGTRGVRLQNGRALTCAVVALHAPVEVSPFAASQALCRKLCPNPRLPSEPVYGGNNWYYAYGTSSHEQALKDAGLIAELAPDCANRPWYVLDDCWQANRRHAEHWMKQCGPWDRGNAGFPDMPGLASAILERGVRPGIWIRPLGAPPGTSESRLLPESRVYQGATGRVPALDPSIPENLVQIKSDIRRLRDWGYGMIKHDWTTCDILGRWGFDMDSGFTSGDWTFADRAKTTAEIIRGLYETIRRGAGEETDAPLLIGCNTIGHLGAGLFELQRTGDDTSGHEWERTRKMGVNTLAFRMGQHETFFAADADCVGLTTKVPWSLNRQWLDVLARSGTPLFVSAAPEAIGLEQKAALKEAFRRAAVRQPAAEPLDWQDTICPAHWRSGEEVVRYAWYE